MIKKAVLIQELKKIALANPTAGFSIKRILDQLTTIDDGGVSMADHKKAGRYYEDIQHEISSILSRIDTLSMYAEEQKGRKDTSEALAKLKKLQNTTYKMLKIIKKYDHKFGDMLF